MITGSFQIQYFDNVIAVPVEVFRLAAAVRAGLAPSSNREEQEDWKRAQAPHRIC